MKIPSTSLSTRAPPITSENKSNAITIATWVTLVTIVLIFISREAVKYGVARKFAADDVLILLATVGYLLHFPSSSNAKQSRSLQSAFVQQPW